MGDCSDGCARLIFLAVWAQAKERDMHAVDLVACIGLELLVERFEQVVADLPGIAAHAADQVMVGVAGDLVHQLPAAHVRRQDQPLSQFNVRYTVASVMPGMAW